MALGPKAVIPQMPSNLVPDIENLIDAKLKGTGSLKGSIELSKDYNQALRVEKIRKEAAKTIAHLYLEAGWATVNIDITGPHSVGCSSDSSYFKVSYTFSESSATFGGRC